MMVCICSKCGRQHKRLLKPTERSQLASKAALKRWIKEAFKQADLLARSIKEGQGDGDSDSGSRVGVSGGDTDRDGVK